MSQGREKGVIGRYARVRALIRLPPLGPEKFEHLVEKGPLGRALAHAVPCPFDHLTLEPSLTRFLCPFPTATATVVLVGLAASVKARTPLRRRCPALEEDRLDRPGVRDAFVAR